jgi:hypothetical protein
LNNTPIGVNLNDTEDYRKGGTMILLPDTLLSGINRTNELSGPVRAVIDKVYDEGESSLTKDELDLLGGPAEVAALLSAKYKRPIRQRYIKELTRDFTNKETGHVTEARLKPSRVVGGAFLYAVRDVLRVRLREKETAPHPPRKPKSV